MLQAAAAAVKNDLMNRLNNALKQRDAAREEALLATEKLNKLQEDLDSGALTPSPAPLALQDPGKGSSHSSTDLDNCASSPQQTVNSNSKQPACNASFDTSC